jgi:hypothetical protein
MKWRMKNISYYSVLNINHLRNKYSEHLGDMNACSIKSLVNPENYKSTKHLCQYLYECFNLHYTDLKRTVVKFENMYCVVY